MMQSERFDRNIRLFGEEGQRRIRETKAVVVGVGGLGSQVVQQIAFLGVGRVGLVDSEEHAKTDMNRNVCARFSDHIPGSRKVDLAERCVGSIDPSIVVEKVCDSLVSEAAFAQVLGADFVFGCLDSEGARLVLTELCAAYAKPYLDVSSDVTDDDKTRFGGQLCFARSGDGCLVCLGLLDLEEARMELSGPQFRAQLAEIYGVKAAMLGTSGPSVVSLNGVMASLAVTEFMCAVTGFRTPNRVLTFHGISGKVTVGTDSPADDCYYCKGIWGQKERPDVFRYIREGVGLFLR